jgi:hypothetical protein
MLERNQNYYRDEASSLKEDQIKSLSQETIGRRDLGIVCFKELRRLCPPYGESSVDAMVKDPRVTEFKKARIILSGAGVDVKAIEKVNEDLGFFGNNLVHGVVDPIERTLVTGVCFPEKPTLQSVLPLLAAKDLIDANKADTLYVALPVFAYAGAGLSRYNQYLETIALMKNLYGNDLGERVFVIPDTRGEIMEMKYKICNLLTRFVADSPAKEKYPFGNLLGYFETASYGADVLIGALAEEGDATIICDFRQFESVHAGNKMGKSMGRRIGALLYTLLSPTYVEGKLREVSQDDEAVEQVFSSLTPETSSLFYQAVMLLSEEQLIEIYDEYRKKGSTDELQKLVNEARTRLFAFPRINGEYVQDLEDKSIAKMRAVNDFLDEEVQKRISISDRDIRRGVIYEHR